MLQPSDQVPTKKHYLKSSNAKPIQHRNPKPFAIGDEVWVVPEMPGLLVQRVHMAIIIALSGPIRPDGDERVLLKEINVDADFYVNTKKEQTTWDVFLRRTYDDALALGEVEIKRWLSEINHDKYAQEIERHIEIYRAKTYGSMRETLAVLSRAEHLERYGTYGKETSAGPPAGTEDGPTTDNRE